MSSCCESSNQNLPLTSMLKIALIGNPNCGKTTLFNALTGARQRVGNWPGVTVERKSGYYTHAQQTIEVVDLPGIYSLTAASAEQAIDEAIACQFILNHDADILINIVDACNLERHLYLTLQLLELNIPMILALNMMDIAKSRALHIDIDKLSKTLGCKVIALSASQAKGLTALKDAIHSLDRKTVFKAPVMYPPAIQTAQHILAAQLSLATQPLALRLLENDSFAKTQVTPEIQQQTQMLLANIEAETQEEADILIADARYRCITELLAAVLQKGLAQTTITERIDRILLNRVLGIPIFLAIMYSLFLFSINIGGAFQDFFDKSSQAFFVDGLAYLLNAIGSPNWLTVLLANGVGKGINTTVTFIPVIGALFLFLAFLEDSGYMARAAFVIDRFMRFLGLPGKAFVPMIVGFGCNVPAVMSARTLENKRDRIITIMMSPFMSCGARLAIYAVFTAAFFPHGGQNIVFGLYLIGIMMAVLTGLMLRTTVLQGEPSPLIMELPAYHLPRFKTLLRHAWQRLKGFVYRAGTLIVPICIILGVLNSLNIDGSLNAGDGDVHSLLSIVGRYTTFIFTPMGIHADNWPATVGLLTGILAKEVVIGTLNTLYTQMGHLVSVNASGGFSLWSSLVDAARSIPENLAALSSAFSNPFLAEAPLQTLNQSVYGLMYKQFDGQIGAFAYLLFVLLYFPCVSTTAVMLRELNRGWALFSIFWMTSIAYGCAVFFYQAATWTQHPYSSSVWMISIISLFCLILLSIKSYTRSIISSTLAGKLV